MRTLIYPGTFDPLTNGHVDIARRAANLCDRLIVAVLSNNAKQPIFSVAERLVMTKTALASIPLIEVTHFEGLLVDYYREVGAFGVVRGLRSESDFRFEAEMAAANRLLYSRFETILLPCRIDLAFTSSSIVREVASYGGDISGMVPPEIIPQIIDRLRRSRTLENGGQTD
jgi:pantetheine-phosphate adenylyltransferase